MWRKRLTLSAVSFFLLASFVIFSKYVKGGGLVHIDFDTTVKLQNRIPAQLDEIMDDGAILADPIVSSALVLLLTTWIFVKVRGKGKLFALMIPVAFVVLTMLEVYGKNMLPHPGPPFFMIKHPTTIFPKFHVVEPYSYPSGHAARITFLAIIFVSSVTYPFGKTQGRQVSRKAWKRKNLIIVALIGTYVAFVALSRIYLGHHWLSDIIGGLLLGGAFALTGSLSTYKRS